MNEMNVIRALMLFLAAAMLILPGAARGEVYVEAYLGGVQGANTALNPTTAHPGQAHLGLHRIP